MARVTVEDCAEVIPSRFELVALAAQRAKMISSGAQITVERNNDKDAVVALREIAGETIDIDKLRDLLVQSCQTKSHVDMYGVEEVGIEEGSDEVQTSSEILEDIAAVQDELPDDADEDLLYGEENLDVED